MLIPTRSNASILYVHFDAVGFSGVASALTSCRFLVSSSLSLLLFFHLIKRSLIMKLLASTWNKSCISCGMIGRLDHYRWLFTLLVISSLECIKKEWKIPIFQYCPSITLTRWEGNVATASNQMHFLSHFATFVYALNRRFYKEKFTKLENHQIVLCFNLLG